MNQIQFLASQFWSGFLMIKITFDLKALCRPLYALFFFVFFVECVVCFCYLYYIIIMMMMIISVWQRSCFHWYILLSIKLWNLLLFCYGWICRVGLHDNLLCCWVINVLFFSSSFRPTCRLALSHSQGSYKRLSQIIIFLAKLFFTYDFWIY